LLAQLEKKSGGSGMNNAKAKLVFRYALSDGIPLRSFYVAIVVGTILNLINQGDALFGHASINWIKIVLTYFVPYAVSTYGAVSYRLSNQAI
jgi:hypothetical protein